MFFKVLLLVAVMSAVFAADLTVKQDWENFKTEYNKNYATPEEEQSRFKIFADNWKAVQEHNKKFAAGEVTWEMGINQFSDLTSSEMKKHTGLLLPKDTV